MEMARERERSRGEEKDRPVRVRERMDVREHNGEGKRWRQETG